MSDANFLLAAPIEFAPKGQTQPWLFAACDLECELRFQTQHEAWARNRLEAMKAFVSPQANQQDQDRFVQHVSANRFAFGAQLSIAFLLSDAGSVEYLTLLAGKAGCRAAGKEALEKLRRSDRPEFDRLVEMMLRRDFPNLLTPAEGGPSPAPATRSPSTTESSSSSVASPGSPPEPPS